MIAITAHDDVLRLEMSSRRSRLVGYSVSAYLVRGVLVDSGFPALSRELARFLGERRPRGMLVTHEHEDHAGNVAVAARLGIPVGASPATVAALRRLPPLPLYRRYTWGTAVPLIGPLDPFADDALALTPSPGHSHDHHVVWDAERETLFGGDLFLGVRVKIAHHAEDPRELVRSLRAAAALRPARLFDAHRGPVPTPVAALTAKADWLDETIAAIDRRIADGWTDAAIRNELLGPEEATGYFSFGEYSRINFIRAVRRSSGIFRSDG